MKWVVILVILGIAVVFVWSRWDRTQSVRSASPAAPPAPQPQAPSRTAPPQSGAAAQPKLLPDFTKINDKFCSGGQPSEAGLAQIAEQGYRSVLNLRTSFEGVDLAAEEAMVKQLGLKYFHIPVVAKSPRDEQADEFLKIVADPGNQPMFIHCGSANRVGAFWMIHRVLKEGWTAEQAEAEARKVGLKMPETRQFALDYIQRHKQ